MMVLQRMATIIGCVCRCHNLLIVCMTYMALMLWIMVTMNQPNDILYDVKEHNSTEGNKANIIPVKDVTKEYDCNHGSIHEPSFQTLDNENYVYSAYVDQRHNDFDNLGNSTHIRIMALVTKWSHKLVCVFSDGIDSVYSTIHTYYMTEHHDRYMRGAILSCKVPSNFSLQLCHITLCLTTNPRHLLLVPLKTIRTDFRTDRLSSQGHRFGLCVPPLFGNLDVARLLEFIELSKMLGVQKFTLYNMSIPAALSKIFNHYGIHLLKWDLPAHLSDHDVWYKGQMVAIQDCLYRNMDQVEFLAFNDLDEFNVPIKYESWNELFDSLTQPIYCSYSFLCSYLKPVARTERAPILLTARSPMRTMQIFPNRKKELVRPMLVFEKGIHHTSKPILSHYKSYEISVMDGLLYHYSHCLPLPENLLSCATQIRDSTLADKYGRVLEKRVWQVLKDLNYDIE